MQLPSPATASPGGAAPAGVAWQVGGAPAISLAGVSKRFRLPEQRHSSVREQLAHPRLRRSVELLSALDSVSFEVPHGSCLGIVGRNGSGKSTLLCCIAGIYLPDSGELRVDGRLASFIELGVGFDREVTARENLITGGMLFGLSGRDVRARVDEILSYAELERFADVKLKNFSSGMATRLGFALATHIDADILLFDEVIATGDLAFQQKCFGRVAQLRDEGRTLVLVTHDMGMIQSLCDRALLLERGELICDGAAADVAERYDAINLGEQASSKQQRIQRHRQRELDQRLPGPDERRAGVVPIQSTSRNPRRHVARIAARFAAVEYRRKYGDAALGYAWAVLRPLSAFAVMYLVFTRVAHFDARVPHYAVYLLTTLVLWTFFLDATTTSLYALVRHADLLRKIPAPRLAIPLSVVLRALLDMAMNLVAVAILLAISGITPKLQWLEVPFLIAVLAVVATGIGLLMSALYVRLRDIDQLWGALSQILFFASPIIYVVSSMPSGLRRPMMALNPLAAIFTQMRHALVDPSAPTAAAAAGGTARLLLPAAVTVALLAAGIVVFRRLAPRAAEDL